MIQTISHTSDNLTVTMIVTSLGNDLNISLFGGDIPHIGAVALAVPHPSLADESKLSATVSTLSVMRHKEDELAKEVAYKVAKTLNKVVSVSCGIHIDDIKPTQLKQVFALVEKCVDEYIK